jgi:hypothetical protein
MKIITIIMLLALLPIVAGAGVIFGNISIMEKEKIKPAGDTLLVVLTSVDQPIPADQLIKSTVKDTTDTYSAFNLFVDGTGSYLLHVLSKTKGQELIEPVAVQLYEEPAEFNLILSPDKSGKGKYLYTARRK